jgi:hypothetical protein
METTKLYRPVNKAELELIQKSKWKRFPPRLPDQYIFYPVTNQEYASQITREWNLPSYKNGFVTEFELSKKYLSKFKVEKVGLDHHTELWVPAEQLEEFNNEIIDRIKVIEAYDSNPNNQYVLVKDTFNLRDNCTIAFEFINKESNFEITSNSKIDRFKLQKYLEIPRKVKSNGELDTETFIVIMEDKFEICPIKEDQIYLLVRDEDE